jgi:hypothetical protein
MNMDRNTVSRSHDRGRLHGHRSRWRKGRDAVVRAEAALAPALGGGPLCSHTEYVRELANQITKTSP